MKQKEKLTTSIENNFTGTIERLVGHEDGGTIIKVGLGDGLMTDVKIPKDFDHDFVRMFGLPGRVHISITASVSREIDHA